MCHAPTLKDTSTSHSVKYCSFKSTDFGVSHGLPPYANAKSVYTRVGSFLYPIQRFACFRVLGTISTGLFSTHEPYYKRQVLKRDGLISDPTRVQHAQNGMIVQHGRRHRIDQRRISIIYVLENMEVA